MSLNFSSTRVAVVVAAITLAAVSGGYILKQGTPKAITSDRPVAASNPTPGHAQPALRAAAVVTNDLNRATSIDPNLPATPVCESSESDLREEANDDDSDHWIRNRDAAIQQLTGSGDIESRLIRLELEFQYADIPEHIRKLNVLQRLDPTNALIAHRMLSLCHPDAAPPLCEQIPVEQNLLRADGDNALAWLRIALHKLHQGDADAALTGLQAAARSPRIRTPWVDWIVVSERALRSVGRLDVEQRHTLAWELGSVTLMAYSLLSEHCQRLGLNDIEWREACLGIGQAMEGDTSNLATMQFGRWIQQVTYLAASNPEMADAAQARALAASQTQRQLDRWSAPKLKFDQARFERYLQTWQNSGEVAALQYLLAETKAATARGEHTPCVDP